MIGFPTCLTGMGGKHYCSSHFPKQPRVAEYITGNGLRGTRVNTAEHII